MARILIVEDDPSIALALRDDLEIEGYDVQVVEDGPTALRTAREFAFDLILLDVMIPGKDGFDVCRELRRNGTATSIIMLTARSQESDMVMGLELGADDYMKKPFSPRELVARVEAQFRRVEMDTAPPAMLDLPGDIKVDLARLEVHRDGQVLALTPREGDILAYLIKHRDRVVTREDLLLDVWHYQSANVETRTVDIHIVGLRRKVEPNPSEPTLIQTVRGKGYRWFDG